MDRSDFLGRIGTLFRTMPIVAILGPRQCGKTTLARMFASADPQFEWGDNYFDLENPTALARLQDPMLTLSRLEGLVIIDEIQRRPELYPLLRVLVDRDEGRSKFLVLGSASPELLRQTSETLAGRIGHLELTPFNLLEVGTDGWSRLWIRGGYPRSFLARSEEDSAVWREEYIRTYLERDLPSLGIDLQPQAVRRFWTMIAHTHGQIFNSSEIGRSMGFSHTTARRYLDILTSTFMVRELRPWFANLKKREVKSPKVYLRDSGLLHRLLGIGSLSALEGNPKLGASWEGFALEEVIRAHKARAEDCYFWAVHGQAEIDLLIHQEGKLTAYEFKYADAPKLMPAMAGGLEALGISTLTVVYPGNVEYPLSEQVVVKPLSAVVAP